MDRKKPNPLGKNIIFSIFLFGSLVLILSMWAIDLTGGEPEAQGYVRATLAIHPTQEGFQLTLEAQPTKEHEPSYSGQGQGQHEVTPTPTFDVDSWVPEDDISDDLADE